MKFGDITNRLSEKQKQRLKEVKTNEVPDNLFPSGKQLLTDDQLGSIAGGNFLGPERFFEPERCRECGGVLDPFYASLGNGCVCGLINDLMTRD